jgi:hypothetical protein
MKSCSNLDWLTVHQGRESSSSNTVVEVMHLKGTMELTTRSIEALRKIRVLQKYDHLQSPLAREQFLRRRTLLREAGIQQPSIKYIPFSCRAGAAEKLRTHVIISHDGVLNPTCQACSELSAARSERVLVGRPRG